jgi:PAS domain S-box-containing protein
MRTERKRKQAEEALQKAHDELERKVEERTANLSKANIFLKREVSERKRAEEQTKQLQEYLKLQINRMPIGLIVWDTEFRVQSWNPAAEKIFGFTADEALGRLPYDLIVPKDVQPHVDIIWKRLLEGDTTAHSVNENITKDGRIIICDWSNTPIKEPDGTVISVLSMAQDITERKQRRMRNYALHRSMPVD